MLRRFFACFLTCFLTYFLACLTGVCAAILATGPARAQIYPTAYPNKVIKLIVPAGPGGPTDILGRLVGDRMSAALAQPVVVEQ